MRTRAMRSRRGFVAWGLLVCLCALAAGAQGATAAAAAPEIAFNKAGSIWVISPDGSGLRRLTKGQGRDSCPTWSPNRSTVAFVRSGRTHRICLVPSARGAVRVLSYRDTVKQDAYYGITGLAYSPDGKRLAFSDSYSVSGSPYTHNRVVVIDLKTHATEVLVRSPRGVDSRWTLSWSPNGKTILVAQNGQSNEGGPTWLLDVAHKRRSNLGIPEACGAAWSPDGKTIVVTTSNWFGTSVLLARPSGEVISVLAQGSWAASPDSPPILNACFSIDGEQIAYGILTQETSRWSLWLMDSDGSGKHSLTVGGQPAWR